MEIYQSLKQKFPKNDPQSRLIRGIILYHHGKHEYEELFDQIKNMYRQHLIDQQYHQSLHDSQSSFKLSQTHNAKLKELTELEQGKDLATYARFLLFDFHS